MKTMARYHMLEDPVHHTVTLFDAVTGSMQHPVCWQDISAYYHYLLGRNRQAEAQHLLAEAMSGNTPMTRMVESASANARVPAR